MSATRVRVVLEFRNGDGNFLRKEFDPDKWVKCRGESDIEALDAAYLIALQHQAGRIEKLRRLLAERKIPSHD